MNESKGLRSLEDIARMNEIEQFEQALAKFFSVAIETSRDGGKTSLSDFAAALERATEFGEVIKTAAVLERTEALRDWIPGEDIFAVRAFLRRSGSYKSLYAGEHLIVTDVAAHFRALLLQSHVNVTYLAPIELIHLSSDQLTFDQFAIRRFSQSELAAITQNEIRTAFYPWAKLNLEVLEDYWFLVATDSVPVRSSFDFTLMHDPRVRTSYTGYPNIVEKGLYPLVLHDWVDNFHPSNLTDRPPKRDANDELFYPNVPFVTTISDYWLQSPEPAPSTKEMMREPFYNGDGEEMGEGPSCAFFFDEEGTKKLEENLREFAARLRLIDHHQPKWRFAYTALGFLSKAFRTEGIEQLLWHITAIEAILGQKLDTGLTNILRRRIAEIFGRSSEGKKSFKKRFNDLYSFRSDLVHGNAEDTDRMVMKGHLAESRDIARGVVAWATGLLAHVAKHCPVNSGGSVPTREDLLLILDMGPATRAIVTTLLQNLPDGFPAVNNWFVWGDWSGFPWKS